MMCNDEACRFAVLMIKRVSIILTLIFWCAVHLHAQEKMNLKLIGKDKGNEALTALLKVPPEFSSEQSINNFLQHQLLPRLWTQGFLSASIDSSFIVGKDYKAVVFLGPLFTWGSINIDDAQKKIATIKLDDLIPNQGARLHPSSIAEGAQAMLIRLEENGYPFASVQFDSSYWVDQQLHAQLKLDAGPLYHIDSIHIDSRMHINPKFLQRYLGFLPGLPYKQSLLMSVSKQLEDLGYVRELKPWNLTLYGTGATLNLYLQAEKSNRIDLMAGLMPSNPLLNGKSQITGDGNIELNNAFGNGEYMLINWQQLQIQSPRLQLHYNRPFMFNSNMGLDLKFNLLKKDSSYINLNSSAGIQYKVDEKQLLKFHVLQHMSNILYVDTQQIKQTKSLQSFLDLSNTQVGIEWLWNQTNDRRNPLKGMDVNLQLHSGWRKIRKQPSILSLKTDANGNVYDYNKLYQGLQASSVQSSMKFHLNRFNQLGTYTTIKLGVQAAWIYGKQLFLNEMYQIGGIKTLRGFDEESIFASSYAIATAEFRYLMDKSSNFFGFIDAAKTQKNLMGVKANRNFFGMGLGMHFMTKSGMFTMAYALGKSDQQSIGLKTSKIHVGFSTLF